MTPTPTCDCCGATRLHTDRLCFHCFEGQVRAACSRAVETTRKNSKRIDSKRRVARLIGRGEASIFDDPAYI